MVKEFRWHSDGARVAHRHIVTPRNSLRVQSCGLKIPRTMESHSTKNGVVSENDGMTKIEISSERYPIG